MFKWFKELRGAKKLNLILGLLLVALLGVAGTYAYLIATTSPVENSFTPATVSCKIDETFTNNIKTNVRIKNTSDVDAYIRASIVVSFVDTDENTVGIVPVLGTDYTMELNLNGTSWFKGGDGFYYCRAKVAPSDFKPVLITEAKPIGNSPYRLKIEIVASAIQSLPTNAVTDAWGVTVDSNGMITEGGQG